MLALADSLSFTWARGTPFEKKAVNNVSVSIGSGVTVAVIGPTGSGKSTFVQLLAGLIRPDSGKVTCPSAVLSFQYPEEQLCKPLVYDEIAFGPRNLRLKKEDVDARVRSSLAMAGLDFATYRDRQTFSLSGGELRKVAVAGVLAMDRDLLILDEPTAGLDPETRTQILNRLLDWKNEGGKTRSLVIVTHDLDEVASKADRILVFKDGSIIRDGAKADVLSDRGFLESLGFELPRALELRRLLLERGISLDTIADDPETTAAGIVSLLALKQNPSGGTR